MLSEPSNSSLTYRPTPPYPLFARITLRRNPYASLEIKKESTTNKNINKMFQFSEEEENYLKLIGFVNNIATPALRVKFNQYFPPHLLPTILKNGEPKLRALRVLNVMQLDLLFPTSATHFINLSNPDYQSEKGNIAPSGVDISDDCATSIDCRGTAYVYSCRHSKFQLSGIGCENTTSSECTRKLQGQRRLRNVIKQLQKGDKCSKVKYGKPIVTLLKA
ncbi:unnamed protein product [Mytilus edulis]|uniref:Uncharacterized protein n=1 Tax=Mytilus edulis TaxID=6550 RepID=A0A8S3RMV5_MYTED|nr:unnamed protein product [Mytilus edulis]